MQIRDRSALLEGDITEKIIGAFYAIYNELGYGFLESVYSGALEIELTERGLPYVREHSFDVEYHRHVVGMFRADFFVVGRVIVEVKSAADSAKRIISSFIITCAPPKRRWACSCILVRKHVSIEWSIPPEDALHDR